MDFKHKYEGRVEEEKSAEYLELSKKLTREFQTILRSKLITGGEEGLEDHKKKLFKALDKISLSEKTLQEIKKDTEEVMKTGSRGKFFIYPPTIYHMVKHVMTDNARETGESFKKQAKSLLYEDKKEVLDSKNFNSFKNEEKGSEYFLKYFAFTSVDMLLLGFEDVSERIDKKMRELSKKDDEFNRYFEYKLFMLKCLVRAGLIHPEILLAKKMK